MKPGLTLGFMTGDRFFEGYDFDRWAEALAGPNRAPVYWRPGGGFYEDLSPGGLVGKSHDIGRQIAFLPSLVLCVASASVRRPSCPAGISTWASPACLATLSRSHRRPTWWGQWSFLTNLSAVTNGHFELEDPAEPPLPPVKFYRATYP